MPALPAGCTLGRSRLRILDIFAGNSKALRTSQLRASPDDPPPHSVAEPPRRQPGTSRLSRASIDHILEDRVHREADGDVEGTLKTFTDDVVHDVGGDPTGELHGLAAV